MRAVDLGADPMSALDEPLRFDVKALLAAERPAKVTLVGAGPGDPELLTLKAVKALRTAQVVLYDNLVGTEVLEHLPESAHRIYVGKQAGHHTLSQEAIIELMLRLARSGRAVVRLKGGDPFIFGRGGEEAQALAQAGVPFEVIPGISAAQGAAASAGIPLTHRDHACSLVFTTGHLRGEGDARTLDLDWGLLARPRQTVVIYMGVATLPIVCEELIRHGLPPDTPAAVVERATRPDERTIDGTLETLPALARVHGVKSPALIVIGAVAQLHAVLAPMQVRALHACNA
jgi:uroporphyrin-III C-methyltransferase